MIQSWRNAQNRSGKNTLVRLRSLSVEAMCSNASADMWQCAKRKGAPRCGPRRFEYLVDIINLQALRLTLTQSRTPFTYRSHRLSLASQFGKSLSGSMGLVTIVSSRVSTGEEPYVGRVVDEVIDTLRTEHSDSTCRWSLVIRSYLPICVARFKAF